MTMGFPSGSSLVLLINLTIIGNKGTFNDGIITGSKNIGQGTGILI